MSKRLLPTLALALLLATGCNLIYKQNIQQGNALEQEDLDQLRLGMSMNQVAYLLGTPAIQDPFHHDRWDYLSWFSRRGGEPTRRTVRLEFRDGALVAMSGIDPDDPTSTTRAPKTASEPATEADGAQSTEEALITPLDTPAATEDVYVEEASEADPEAMVPVAAEPELETGPVDRTATDAVEEMISVEEIGETLKDDGEETAETPPVTDEWVIQLGAFDSEANARRVLQRLSDAGYPAVMTERSTTGSGIRYLVRQQGIASRSDAMRLLEEIEDELGINGFLLPAGE